MVSGQQRPSAVGRAIIAWAAGWGEHGFIKPRYANDIDQAVKRRVAMTFGRLGYSR
jgi:hypothetical protein